MSSVSKNNTNNDFPKLFAQSSCKLAIWVECKSHVIFIWGMWGSIESLKPSWTTMQTWMTHLSKEQASKALFTYLWNIAFKLGSFSEPFCFLGEELNQANRVLKMHTPIEPNYMLHLRCWNSLKFSIKIPTKLQMDNLVVNIMTFF